MNGTSCACFRVASSITIVPFAFTVKSMIGSLAAQSCDGCAAACTTSARSFPYFANTLLIAVGIADVRAHVRVARAELLLELLALPRRAGLLAEEHAAHVVVDAHDIHPEPGEVRRCLRANEAGRAGDDRDASLLAPVAADYRLDCPTVRIARMVLEHVRAPVRADALRFRGILAPRRAAASRCAPRRRRARDRPPRRPRPRESHPPSPIAPAPRRAPAAQSPSTRTPSSESRSRRRARRASPRAHPQARTRS